MLLLAHMPLQRGPRRSAILPPPAPLRSALDGHVHSSVPTEFAGARSSGQGPSGHPGEPLRGAALARRAPGSAGSGGGGVWGAKQLWQREGRDAVIALCSRTAAWEWRAHPPPPGRLPAGRAPAASALAPGSASPKHPHRHLLLPSTDPAGTSALVPATWPRPGQGGQSRSQAGFSVGGVNEVPTPGA